MNKSAQTSNSFFGKYAVAYAAFSIVGLYLIFLGKDRSMGFVLFALAGAFDPFDQQRKWADRPRFQQIWLFIHVFLMVALAGYVFLAK